jgi:uncharacterized membrane protein YcaP (DUF421 family)
MHTLPVLASISDDLFTIGVPLLEKVLRTVAVYAGILVLLRIAGRRDLAQLNSFDLVVLLLLSNVVQNAIIGADNSLWGGIVGAVTLLAVNAVVVRLAQHSDATVALLEGTPERLVEEGRADPRALARLGLRLADLRVALARQGAPSIEQVEDATLEPGGSIVVQLRQEATPATRADVDRLEAKLDRLLQAR